MLKLTIVPIRTIVIGLGRAGWLIDLSRNGNGQSHSFSILGNKNYRLVAGVDPDSTRREAWSQFFGIPAFRNIETALQSEECDLIVIATPIESLFPTLQTLLRRQEIFNILVEKPVISHMSNYQDLLEIASRSGNRIVVNLPRLFAPENAIISKYLGNDSLNRISGNYSGGYINTFLHVVTFVNSIFPDSHWQSAFQNGKHYINIYRNERIVGEINEMQKKKISAFDLEIHNNLGILNYLEGGTLIYYSTNDSIIQIENTRGHFQRNVYDYIAVSGWHNAVKRAGLEHILPSISTFLELDPRA